MIRIQDIPIILGFKYDWTFLSGVLIKRNALHFVHMIRRNIGNLEKGNLFDKTSASKRRRRRKRRIRKVPSR